VPGLVWFPKVFALRIKQVRACGPRALGGRIADLLADLRSFDVSLLGCLIASGGTLQVRLLSSSPLMNLVSADRNILNSLQAS